MSQIYLKPVLHIHKLDMKKTGHIYLKPPFYIYIYWEAKTRQIELNLIQHIHKLEVKDGQYT